MTARILVVDNYDSFVFNLVQYLYQLGVECEVRRNDELETADPRSLIGYAGVLVSPGPGTPERAGASVEVIRQAARCELPVLGVCLGLQAIAVAYGGRVAQAPELLHGKTSLVEHQGAGVLDGLPSPFRATRYHSLAVDPAQVPAELEVTASTTFADGASADGASTDGASGDTLVVMAARHRHLPIEGVQFHPESVLTEHGHRLLANWLSTCGETGAVARSAGLAPVVGS